MKAQHDSDNLYALKNDLVSEIFISEVKYEDRGRGLGYFCLGCKRRLQAVLFTVDNHQSYFRHDAEDVKGQPKCTYSDETHRHILGKEILQRLKSIRVPNLYKYSPNKEQPRKYLLSESQFISASTVLNEHYLYEDENGEIHYSKNKPAIDEEELLIQPDVLFLDSKGKPILIIELVATHKPDRAKLIKLKRLGIDAVQVRIPRDSPEAIEMAFKQTINTHWIYNHVEENTEYLPISGSPLEGVSPVDDEQKRFFEETFLCRSAQIGNLIRKIERLLESERYRQIVSDFESEVQRVEGNTRRAEQRLDELRDEHGERGADQYSERRKAIRGKREEFQNRRRGLETRYSKKRSELEGESATVATAIAEIEYQLEELDNRGERAGGSIEEEKRSIENLEGRIADAVRSRERIESNLEFTQRNVDEETRKMDDDIIGLRSENKEKGKRLERDYVERTENIRRQIATTTFDEEGLRRELSNKHPTNREEYLNRVAAGDYHKSGWFTTEHEKLRELDASIRIYLTSFEELQAIEQGNRN